jgi:hypothetical protein
LGPSEPAQIEISNPLPLLPPAARGSFYKNVKHAPVREASAKIFHWEGLDTVFFFVSLRVPSRLKTGGGFWVSTSLAHYLYLFYNFTAGLISSKKI